jgi:O-antigen/teichoic acid export membrane protein
LSVFPRFAAVSGAAPDAGALDLPGRAARLTLALMVPASLATIVLAYPLLEWWLGGELALASGLVLQVFALSVLINAPAGIAFILLQARGYARWSAWLHLAELPVTVIVLFAAVVSFGVTGAATVWLLRIAIDTAALFWLARRIEPSFVSGRLVAGLVCGVLSALILIAMVKASADWLMTGALAAVLVAVSLAIIVEKREFTSLLPTPKPAR